MPLPNVILIGAQKAGTTSLYSWIAQHPDVYGDMAMKDFPYFIMDNYYNRGLNWFGRCFRKAKDQRVILHGSVQYIYFYNISARRLYKYNKNLKLILILRNPIERAYSAFWDAVKIGLEDSCSFEEALKLEEQRKKIKDFNLKAHLTYVDHGFYYEQLVGFYNYFAKSQIKVLLFEDILNNKKRTIKEIYDFLEIDNSFIPTFDIKNTSGVPRIKWLQKFLIKPILPQAIKEIVPINIRIKLKKYLIRNLNKKKYKYPPLKEETKHFLRKIYNENIIKLQALIDRDLTIWLQ